MTTASPPGRIFYGWWIVLGCGIMAVVGWSLAIFGMGVYIHVLSEQRGLSIGFISTAVTFSFLVNAACLTSAGTLTARFGAKPAILIGAAAMAMAATRRLLLLRPSSSLSSISLDFSRCLTGGFRDERDTFGPIKVPADR